MSAKPECVPTYELLLSVRLPPQGLALFEAVVNAMYRAAPTAAIAFNTQPEETAPPPGGCGPAERLPRTEALLRKALAARPAFHQSRSLSTSEHICINGFGSQKRGRPYENSDAARV